MPPPESDVGHARADGIDAMAQSLARAFTDDPLTTWLFPSAEGRARKLPAFFRSLLRASFPFGEVYSTRDHRGVAIWNPPGTFPLGRLADAWVGLTTARLVGPRILSCSRGLLYFVGHHPKERHWYLQMLGTDPDFQGAGRGSAVMTPVLERCDREGERVYLESSKERNIPFYERHGFEVAGEMRVPGGPVVWPMWREPRPSP